MKGDLPLAAVRLAAKLTVRTHERKLPPLHPNEEMNLGRVVCWLLRRHHWRRLRIAEQLMVIAPLITGDEAPDPQAMRICSRCGATRLAKRRNHKL